MAKTFEETQDILPRGAFIIMSAVLIATDAFMLICHFIESLAVPLWMFAAASVVFGGIIIFCFTVKLKISVVDDAIHIRFLKRYNIPFGEVIDHKIGDIDVIRNYSGWGMKKVTFKNLICAGYDKGVSLKLTGRRVVTVSLGDPEKFASLLPPAQS
ncbi:MAG: hypothetical protein LBP82_00980 [Candidatus Methanoplasma sp.]|jgi:hypothetical protein|nr:hypothetical protein [Candidatus Methanoplasma sp.]